MTEDRGSERPGATGAGYEPPALTPLGTVEGQTSEPKVSLLDDRSTT